MTRKIDVDQMAQEVLTVLQNHGLSPTSFTIFMEIAQKDFESLVADRIENHAFKHPMMISVKGNVQDIHWVFSSWKVQT